MFKSSYAVLVMFLVMTTFASSAFAQEIPSEVEIDTSITVGGRFTIRTTFRNEEGEAVRVNRRDRCRVLFYANISESGEVTASGRRIGLLRLRRGRPNGVNYDVRRLRPVRDQGGDAEDDAIITAQAQLICGRGENRVRVLSDASARYIICGRALPADAPRRFLRRVTREGSARAVRSRI